MMPRSCSALATTFDASRPHFVVVRLLQEAGIAEDHAERRAQLVRGDGDEIALELVELAEFVVGFLQRRHHLRAFDGDRRLRRDDRQVIDVVLIPGQLALVDRFEHADHPAARAHRHAQQRARLKLRRLVDAGKVALVVRHVFDGDRAVFAQDDPGDAAFERNGLADERLPRRIGGRRGETQVVRLCDPSSSTDAASASTISTAASMIWLSSGLSFSVELRTALISDKPRQDGDFTF